MGAADFLTQHGYWVILLAVLADQIGLPLPAAPFLVAAGALVRAGSLQATWVLVISISASLVGHAAWYWAGRTRGAAVLRRVCQLSLEPEACVRRAQDMFTRLGPMSLLIARFVPGIDTMAQPLAGMSGMPPGRYLALTLAGAAIWSGTLLAMGMVFGEQLATFAAPALRLTRWLLPGLAGFLAFYVLYKLARRYRTLRGVDMPRMTVDQLKERLDAGEPMLVVDLRHALEARLHPHTIPGAVRLSRSELQQRLTTLPPAQTVVLFCNCPHEIASARLALALNRQGRSGALPLEGGLDAWEDKAYPVAKLSS